MLEIIIGAIRNRETLSFTYSGIARVVEPHAVGISSAGNNVLRCYQTQGGHINSSHNWDLCVVSKIVGLRTTGVVFASARPDYKPGDKGMIRIFAEL